MLYSLLEKSHVFFTYFFQPTMIEVITTNPVKSSVIPTLTWIATSLAADGGPLALLVGRLLVAAKTRVSETWERAVGTSVIVALSAEKQWKKEKFRR